MKFRCKVIRRLMSDWFSEIPIFRVLGDFSVGVEIYILLG